MTLRKSRRVARRAIVCERGIRFVVVIVVLPVAVYGYKAR